MYRYIYIYIYSNNNHNDDNDTSNNDNNNNNDIDINNDTNNHRSEHIHTPNFPTNIIPLLRLLDSSFPGSSPWAWEFHPLESNLCSSQAL